MNGIEGWLDLEIQRGGCGGQSMVVRWWTEMRSGLGRVSDLDYAGLGGGHWRGKQ